ncbi:Rieske (2Fe-2S) protein [Streptomyces sp. NBC_01451]|uniref:Rieske (2Fe-2S) protein n=1 Tax=Streptomyces sp. NBC_01451 TaxID=2903872 RepID=UPI002E3784EE|nr:Rieske (2Fe-2S) protein [Streptomyces sp. NBC_01451]
MSSASLQPVSGPARRTVMAAAGAAGLAVALTACGSDDDTSDSATEQGAAAGTALAKTSDIPEGGGKIFKEQGVVVTQPTAGTYKAFSSKCTHAGCAVTGITNGVITCPCHNSEFSVADGSVKKGPATEALAAESITVSGDSITLA